MGQSHYKIPERTSEIPYIISGGSQLLVESPGPLGLVRESYLKTEVEAWISRHVELYYITTCQKTISNCLEEYCLKARPSKYT